MTMCKEMQERKEGYLARAEIRPLLDEIVRGEKSFTEEFERTMAECESPPKGMGSLVRFIEEVYQPYKDYVLLASELAPAALSEEQANDAIEYCSAVGVFPLIGGFNGASWWLEMGSSAVSVVLPIPFNLIPLALMGAGALGYFSSRGIVKSLKKTLGKKEECLGPLRDAARCLDWDVARCFLYEHFMDNRPRFEKTYRGMSAWERQDADAELSRMLSAGCLDMGKTELDNYLRSIVEEDSTHFTPAP